MASLLDKIFPSRQGKLSRPFLRDKDCYELSDLRATRAQYRDQPLSTGVAEVPDEPLDLGQFAAQPHPPPATSSDEAATGQVAIADSAPHLDQPTEPAAAPIPPSIQGDRLWQQSQLAIAGAIVQQMLTQNMLPNELAVRACCPLSTIENLMVGKAGALTLDGLAKILKALGAVPVIQPRPIGAPGGAS